MQVYQEGDGFRRQVPGPADLFDIREGHVVAEGPLGLDEYGRWAFALGLAILRGVTVERRP